MKLDGSTIAVTGASGFIGRHITERLLQRGARVLAVVRNPDRMAVSHPDVEIRQADLGDTDALINGFRGADAVVSNAAFFRIRNTDARKHMCSNVEGTANTMEAVAASGVSRVIHISSVAVYRWQGRRIANESAPQLSIEDLNSFNAYSVSKAASEAVAWDAAGRHGFALTCARPSSVFGPFDPNITRVIRSVLEKPVAPVPCGMKAGLVYAGDVAEAVCLMLEKDVSIGRSYNITGPHDDSRRFLKAWKDSGGPWPVAAVPVWIPFKRLWDNSLAQNDLGWDNSPWEESLAETFRRDPAFRTAGARVPGRTDAGT